MRDFQEFIIALHPHHPILREHRLIEGIGARKCRGVRTRCARAEFRATDFNHHEGLTAFRRQARYLEKFASILKPFDKPGDHPSGRVVQ
jgi:hypothetical protein